MQGRPCSVWTSPRKKNTLTTLTELIDNLLSIWLDFYLIDIDLPISQLNLAALVEGSSKDNPSQDRVKVIFIESNKRIIVD